MKHRLVQYCAKTNQWLQRIPWLRYTLGVTLFLTFMATVFVVLPAFGVHADETGNEAVDGVLGFFEIAGINGLLTFGGYVIMGITHFIMGVALFCLNFFIVLAGYNGFMDAPIVQIGWTMVRDLANMFFIVALLVIAFAQILGREEYALKKTMGKLVLMAILVNFSLLISQLIIDVAHVVTMTFLNAIVATAGGNMINMFSFNEVSQVLAAVEADGVNDGLGLKIFLTAVLSIFMSIGSLLSIGVYTVMMLVRIVTLWVLLVLSPITYALSALPGTQQAAQKWWGEFTKNVMSAPLIVFFLWLAFATLGNGAIIGELTNPSNNSLQVSRDLSEQSNVYFGQQSITLSTASTWENLGAFSVAVALLWAGIGAVQQLGARGGGGLGKVTDFAKKAAFYGSGLFAAQWGIRKGIKYAPVIGTESLKRKGRTIASVASIQKAKMDQGRDERIARITGDKGVKGAVGNFFKSGRYKEKVTKDWEKAAENQKTIYDEEISTSSATFGGKAKLNTAVRKDIAEKRAAVAKTRKFANTQKELLGKEQDEHLGAYVNSKEEIEKSTMSDKEKEAALKQLDKEYSQKMRYSMFVKDTHEFEQEARILEGEVKDFGQTIQGKPAKFAEQAARQLILDQMKVYDEMSITAMKARAIEIQDKVSKALDDGNSGEASRQLKELELLRSAAKNKGSFEGAEVDNALAENAGYSGTAEGGNLASQFEKEVAILGGKKGKTKTAEIKSLLENENDQEMQRVVKQSIQSRKKAALDGQLAPHGLIVEEEDKRPGKAGQVRLRMLDSATAGDNDKYKKSYEGIASYVSIDKIADVDALVSMVHGAGADPEAKIVTREDFNAVVNVLRGFKGNSKPSASLLSSLEKVLTPVVANAGLRRLLSSKLSAENKEAINKQLQLGGVTL